ncbi:hypothetical protein FBR05_05430 [Deltaproteobacteria bacterium PRO3]|nr:hypothetical protein [Deltaproteobacteria bacterium PRO3]
MKLPMDPLRFIPAESSPTFPFSEITAGIEMSPSTRRQMESITEESDPEIRGRELFAFAMREEGRGNAELSVKLLAWLVENGEGEARRQARQRMDATSGQGEFGSRFEYLLDSFVREASNPATLAAMAAGGIVYRGARAATIGRLAGRAGFFGRGGGLRLAGGLVGFAAEAPTFTAVGRLCRGVAWSDEGLGEELLSSYLVLGGLKGAGAAAKELSRRAGHPGLARWTALGGMYAGVMLGHGLETVAGLREWRPGGIEFVEGAALLLQLQVSGRLLHAAAGPRYASFERELETRADLLSESLPVDRLRAANDGSYPPVEPAANGPHRQAEARTWAMASGGESWGMEPPGAPFRKFQVFAGEDRPGEPTYVLQSLAPNVHKLLEIPVAAKSEEVEAAEAPVPRSQDGTRPIDGLWLTAQAPAVGLARFRIYRPDVPVTPQEAVYRVKDLDPAWGTVTLELDPSHPMNRPDAPRELTLEINETLRVSSRERLVLDVSRWQAREVGMPDLAEVLNGKPLEVPQERSSFFGIGTEQSIRNWYGRAPTARLAQIEVFQVPGKPVAWMLNFRALEGEGQEKLVLVKHEEAQALGLADSSGGLLETAEARAQELRLVERSPGATYAWGVQPAARLVSQGMHQLDFTLYLDDLAPMHDGKGRETPFLILGRGEGAFGSEYFRDPQVSREHLKISFPDPFWIRAAEPAKKREGGYIEVENLSPNPVWTLRRGESPRPLSARDAASADPSGVFRQLQAGDQIVLGPYVLTLAFRRGLSTAKGEFEAKKATASNAPPSRPRPLENLELAPGEVYELGRNLRPSLPGLVPVSIAQPFIASRHARLLYEPGSGGPGKLRMEALSEERHEGEIAAEFYTEDGRRWNSPDLEGIDRDLALPPSQIRELLEPQAWVYVKGEKGWDWRLLAQGESFELAPGSLLALGRLARPEKGIRWIIDAQGHRDLEPYDYPWNLRDAVVYQFSETGRGGLLTLYRFDED